MGKAFKKIGTAGAIGMILGGPIAGLIGNAYDKNKEEKKTNKKVAEAQKKAAEEAKNEIMSAQTPAERQYINTTEQRRRANGVNSTYTATSSALKSTFGV